jgi:hypothetical protein
VIPRPRAGERRTSAKRSEIQAKRNEAGGFVLAAFWRRFAPQTKPAHFAASCDFNRFAAPSLRRRDFDPAGSTHALSSARVERGGANPAASNPTTGF